jgi:SP family sugar:H+ symporter-like MFS transporter
MGIYTVLCVPETKGVSLESIHHLFEGNIIQGCIRDTIPRYSRAKQLQHHHITNDAESETSVKPGPKNVSSGVQHIEEA